MRKYFEDDYLISLPKLNKHQKKEFFASNWSVFSPKLGEDQKNGLRRKLKHFFAKIRWRIRSFLSDHPALKSRWGDAKSRWGTRPPYNLNAGLIPIKNSGYANELEIAWKTFLKTFFFLENTCACVLCPWPWPRAFLSLALASDFFCVLGKAVLGLGLGFFLCPWPWPRALCPRLHLWLYTFTKQINYLAVTKTK